MISGDLSALAALPALLARMDVMPEVSREVAAALNGKLHAAEARPGPDGVTIVRTDGKGAVFLADSIADLAQTTADAAARPAAERALR